MMGMFGSSSAKNAAGAGLYLYLLSSVALLFGLQGIFEIKIGLRK
jgi:hypothetical protein